MQCQTRSLRLATSLRISALNKLFITTSIKLNVFIHTHRLHSSAATQPHIQFSESSLNTNISHPSIVINTTHQTPYKYDYEIRLGSVIEHVPPQKLIQLQEQCGQKCVITKTRDSKALYLETNNESDIPTFQSLIHTEFLQHKTSIDAGDKIRFVTGPKYQNIYKLQKKTNAFLYLNFSAQQIIIYGTQTAVDKARQELLNYLSKIIFIELDNKISWICARNHVWIDKMKTHYECEIYSERTGRLVIIAEPHISKKIIHSVNDSLRRAPPDSEIRNTKVRQYQLAQQISKLDSISDVIRVVRNNHALVNINNIDPIFHKLQQLRHSEMAQESVMSDVNEFKKYTNVSSQQRFDDAMAMRRKKNCDFMFFMSKFAKKLLSETTDIRTVALYIYSFAIFGMNNQSQQMKDLWPVFLHRYMELYRFNDPKAHDQKGKDFNTKFRKLHTLSKVLKAMSIMQPTLAYAQYKSHLSFLLKELHSHLRDLDGSTISYALNAIANSAQKTEKFTNLCRNCSFLTSEETNVWTHLSAKENYRYRLSNLGHINVSLILQSICVLFGENGNHNLSENIGKCVLHLCDELFFFHDSLDIAHSIQIITDLAYLGFYEETLFNFLLPLPKMNKIDANDTQIYNKRNIHLLLYSFGKTLHICSDPQILHRLTKQLIEYRSTFSFEQLIECIWSILALHFISSEQSATHSFVLSKTVIHELFKTLQGRIAGCDVSFLGNDIVMKLLQIQCVSNIIRLSSTPVMPPLFQTMLKDGLHSELSHNNNENCDWDRNAYNLLLLQCINSVLYGSEIESDSFLMKNKYELQSGNSSTAKSTKKEMQFGHVESETGLLVHLCVNEREKSGIMVYGPEELFGAMGGGGKLCGEHYLNHHLLTTYFEWNLLCLNWKLHQTKQQITPLVQEWFQNQSQYKKKRLSANNKIAM